jgi:trk system potassium uptake protein TrkH
MHFFDNPARVMVTTFFLMCLIGWGLLLLPFSTTDHPLSLIDAAFTAVSAVCVTGLVVKDTAVDFSIFGQGIILLLIQLGGLGIMSIASLAVHLMGRRFSLQRERVFANVVQTERSEVRKSLVLIFKTTFIVETIGAAVLALLFYLNGDVAIQAIWRGLFTAISGFCNAGFALQSDSLINYQNSGMILQVIALLIILGGMAPIAVVSLPKLIRGKRISVEARITWITSATLLIVGMIAWIVFESNGLLGNLSIYGKLQNAWFQSTTLRTAGFNSLELADMSDPMYLFSMVLMFIGGSPGGTAGGIKTTTIAIIAMTFWMRARNRKELIYANRQIQTDTVFQAITIFIAGLLVWILLLLMLDVTQNIPMRLLAFETTSALGTVGLTLGATPMLDEIGKMLIIFAMFAGRIGPLTIFMLLSEPSKPEVSLQYPKATLHIG